MLLWHVRLASCSFSPGSCPELPRPPSLLPSQTSRSDRAQPRSFVQPGRVTSNEPQQRTDSTARPSRRAGSCTGKATSGRSRAAHAGDWRLGVVGLVEEAGEVGRLQRRLQDAFPSPSGSKASKKPERETPRKLGRPRATMNEGVAQRPAVRRQERAAQGEGGSSMELTTSRYLRVGGDGRARRSRAASAQLYHRRPAGGAGLHRMGLKDAPAQGRRDAPALAACLHYVGRLERWAAQGAAASAPALEALPASHPWPGAPFRQP